MPIEIKELYIKAVVSDTNQKQQPASARIDVEKMKKEIVQQCVQQVLKEIKQKNER